MKKLYTFITLLTILAAFTITAAASTTTDVATPEEFLAAYNAAGNGDIIRLTANIELPQALPALNRSITFDLNGRVLHVTTSVANETALTVLNYGNLTLAGSGAFNLTSVAGNGLVVQGNGRATVNNVTAGGSTAVLAENSTIVVVRGNITGTDTVGLRAANNAVVRVYGNISSTNTAVHTSGAPALFITGNITSHATAVMTLAGEAVITINGNVSGNAGLVIIDENEVTVYGNVSGGNALAVRASHDASVTIRGAVTGYSGINATESADVYIRGNITTTDANPSVIANGDGVEIIITGNVSGRGISVRGGAEVAVYGNVTGVNEAVTIYNGWVRITGNANGTVYARGGIATVAVGGEIIATGTAGVGVQSSATNVQLTVHAAAIRSGGTGVNITGGTVTLHAPVIAQGIGARARTGATLTVHGNVTASGARGIDVDGILTEVTVRGNVSGGTGIIASRNAVVEVIGNVAGTALDGIAAVMGANVTVDGNVNGRWHGVLLGGGSGQAIITVNGDITTEGTRSELRYTDGAYLLPFLAGRINLNTYTGDIMPHLYAFITTFPGFAQRALEDYDRVSGGYYIFELGTDILRLEQDEDDNEEDDEDDEDEDEDDNEEDDEDETTSFFMFLDSYYITNAVDNTIVETMDVRPVLVDGRTMVPARFVSYVLGATPSWYGPRQEVTITIGEQSVTFAIGELAPGMDVPAQIIQDRTMIPLRFVIEFFGAEVAWDQALRRITITV